MEWSLSNCSGRARWNGCRSRPSAILDHRKQRDLDYRVWFCSLDDQLLPCEDLRGSWIHICLFKNFARRWHELNGIIWEPRQYSSVLLTPLQGIVISAGGGPNHSAIGFKYWHDPGPFVQFLGVPGSWGRFLGFWTVFANAAYAYASIEAISIAASETYAPRRNIPKAAKRVFIRVILFYGNDPSSWSFAMPGSI